MDDQDKLAIGDNAKKAELLKDIGTFLEHHANGKAELDGLLARTTPGTPLEADLRERVREFDAVGKNIARILKVT